MRGREQFDQHGRDRPVDHRHQDDEIEQQQQGHDVVDLRRIGLGRIACRRDRRRHRRRERVRLCLQFVGRQTDAFEAVDDRIADLDLRHRAGRGRSSLA